MADSELRRLLQSGAVIPAHPLALTAARRLDERRQRALTRYYCAAGAGGVAIGVHTTQFAIRDPQIGLLEPVLRLGIETVQAHEQNTGRRLIKVAGVCGDTAQALREAAFAREAGYDLGLLSLAALREASSQQLIEHCRQVAAVIPLFGFYLQPAVGGRLLDYDFWREFFEIENVMAVKIAPFNRYQTLDVMRALAGSGRQREIALYTGNDDNIVADLLTEFRVGTDAGPVSLRFAGGLLGHWAVWTRRAVELLHDIRAGVTLRPENTASLLTRSAEHTDANAVLFDARHNFAGCIAGLHEILRRQGLLAGRWCLDPAADLSPGQMREIDRIRRQYPHLTDDTFVATHLDEWLRD
ncbi:MAG: dihydrodipicolinate synthase family protein [Blastocatellia bacterium]